MEEVCRRMILRNCSVPSSIRSLSVKRFSRLRDTNVWVLCEGTSTITTVEYIHPKKKESNSIIEMFLFFGYFLSFKKTLFSKSRFSLCAFLFIPPNFNFGNTNRFSLILVRSLCNCPTPRHSTLQFPTISNNNMAKAKTVEVRETKRCYQLHSSR